MESRFPAAILEICLFIVGTLGIFHETLADDPEPQLVKLYGWMCIAAVFSGSIRRVIESHRKENGMGADVEKAVKDLDAAVTELVDAVENVAGEVATEAKTRLATAIESVKARLDEISAKL